MFPNLRCLPHERILFAKETNTVYENGCAIKSPVKSIVLIFIFLRKFESVEWLARLNGICWWIKIAQQLIVVIKELLCTHCHACGYLRENAGKKNAFAVSLLKFPHRNWLPDVRRLLNLEQVPVVGQISPEGQVLDEREASLFPKDAAVPNIIKK